MNLYLEVPVFLYDNCFPSNLKVWLGVNNYIGLESLVFEILAKTSKLSELQIAHSLFLMITRDRTCTQRMLNCDSAPDFSFGSLLPVF